MMDWWSRSAQEGANVGALGWCSENIGVGLFQNYFGISYFSCHWRGLYSVAKFFWRKLECCDLFQSALTAVDQGLSLWLPQLRNYNKLSTASAEDSSEVRICSQ